MEDGQFGRIALNAVKAVVEDISNKTELALVGVKIFIALEVKPEEYHVMNNFVQVSVFIIV